MHDLAADLTRHDGGGDAIASRLPSAPKERPEAATALIDRAVLRWALGHRRLDLLAVADMMLADHRAAEPLDMCVRTSRTAVEVSIGNDVTAVPLAA